jgi:hypothetical protein
MSTGYEPEFHPQESTYFNGTKWAQHYGKNVVDFVNSEFWRKNKAQFKEEWPEDKSFFSDRGCKRIHPVFLGRFGVFAEDFHSQLFLQIKKVWHKRHKLYFDATNYALAHGREVGYYFHSKQWLHMQAQLGKIWPDEPTRMEIKGHWWLHYAFSMSVHVWATHAA